VLTNWRRCRGSVNPRISMTLVSFSSFNLLFETHLATPQETRSTPLGNTRRSSRFDPTQGLVLGLSEP
jgi:hypothetical protein